MIYKDAWLKYVQILQTIDIFLGVHHTNLVYICCLQYINKIKNNQKVAI